MKAEEILGHANQACEIPMTIEVVTKKDALESMKKYARIQIEKDRERIKNEFNDGPFISIEKVLEYTPITLD